MKYNALSIGLAALLIAACSVNEMDINTPVNGNEEFLASIEDASTKVYVDDDLKVLWHADDRVSIFNKYTYNQEYRFSGKTGANSGSFKKVPNDDFVTGNALDLVYAVYPYQKSTEISNQGVLTIDHPATQSYAENSFGVGANTMVSCSEGNELLFKNLCGYIMLKLYGDNVSVKSISLKGNNNEPLAGTATVNASIDSAPTLTFGPDASKEITLTFDTPVTIGTTAKTATTFWLVVPPTVFSKGFTLTVKDNKNGVFEKSTTKGLEIIRNKLTRMSVLSVRTEATQPNNEIWYTTTDERTIFPTPFSALDNYVSNVYNNGKGILTFYQELTEICDYAFRDCTTLESVSIPQSVTSIGYASFYGCSSLTYVDFPESLKTIGTYAFGFCYSLASITLPEDVTTIDYCAFFNDLNLASINIPKNLTEIGDYAFSECSKLTTVSISDKIQTIGKCAFSECTSLISIRCEATVPPSGRANMFHDTNNCPIYVPSQSIEAYKKAQYWSEYAHRIKPIQDIPSILVPEAIDLGLSVKWASFNLGASKAEEYGDYYAWGETEPYYISQYPLIWKEGKETGYDWPSYKWCMGSFDSLTKYCMDSSRGYYGFTDGKTVLDPEDDAAHMNLGSQWRMPTKEEMSDLISLCSWNWTVQNGTEGYLITGPNGNSIFLPAAGRYSEMILLDAGYYGQYWSSSDYSPAPSSAGFRGYLDFTQRGARWQGSNPTFGRTIRPVYAE